MKQIIVERGPINLEKLDKDLRTALGVLVFGVSTHPGSVIVHLDDTATSTDETTARVIVTNHDETLLTTEQQTLKDLEQKRLDYADSLNPDLITLSELAERVAWIEQEIHRMTQS